MLDYWVYHWYLSIPLTYVTAKMIREEREHIYENFIEGVEDLQHERTLAFVEMSNICNKLYEISRWSRGKS